MTRSSRRVRPGIMSLSGGTLAGTRKKLPTSTFAGLLEVGDHVVSCDVHVLYLKYTCTYCRQEYIIVIIYSCLQVI